MNITYRTRPEDRGQTVEIAWGRSPDAVVERRYDRSDGTTTYTSFESCDCAGECDEAGCCGDVIGPCDADGELAPIAYRVLWDEWGTDEDLPAATDLEQAVAIAEDLPGLDWDLDRTVESRISATVQGRRGSRVVEERSIVIVIEPDHAALIRDVMGDAGCGDAPDEHDWSSEGEGGCDENPGVWSGGGTTMHYASHCAVCGLRRRETHYGSQREPGQGDKIEYAAPDAGGER